MGNLSVNLSEKQYYQIREFYSQSSFEQFGVMYANLDGNSVNVFKLDFFTPDMLEKVSEKDLVISEESLYNMVLYAIGNNFNVMIFIHTHPNKGIAYLSDTDKKSLKIETKIFKDCKFDLFPIECVLTSKGLNFFIWDDKKDDAVRLECYVNGVLEQDAEKKNFFQIFIEDFNKRLYKRLYNLKK